MNVSQVKDLDSLKDLSARMGGDPLLIQASGGNTLPQREGGVVGEGFW